MLKKKKTHFQKKMWQPTVYFAHCPKHIHGPKHNRKKKLHIFMEKLAEKDKVSQNIYFSFVKHLIVPGK